MLTTEVPPTQPIKQLPFTPVLPRTKAIYVMIFLGILLIFLVTPVPYYQSEEVYCKPGQMNCPGIGWHWNKPLYQSFQGFLQSSPRSQNIRVDTPQSTLLPTTEVTPEPTGSAATADWKTFKEEKNRIEFKYPLTWHYRQAPDWTFDVYLEDRPFEIPEATEFLSSIQIHFNEVQNTVTNQKYFMEKTMSEAQTRIADLFDPQSLKVVEDLKIGGKQAIQIFGITGPGPLQGDYFKYTIIQLDNKLLFVVLHGKKHEVFYDQILSTFKFTDQNNEICDLDQKYQNTAVNPVTCQCPDGYEWEIVNTSFGPCPAGKAKDCPQMVQKCSPKN